MKLTLFVIWLLCVNVFGYKQEDKDGSSIFEEDRSFWGRSLLRGASMSVSFSFSMDIPTVAPPSSSPAPSPVSEACEILYASDSAGNLFMIDVVSETLHPLKKAPSRRAIFAYSDIEYDVSTDIILSAEGVRGDIETGARLFGTIARLDPKTGEKIDSFGRYEDPPFPVRRIRGLEFIGSTLYAVSSDIRKEVRESFLSIVDTNTGSLTEIGLTGYDEMDGLAFDGKTLWSVSNTITSGPRPAARLVTVNVETGKGKIVANLMDKNGDPVRDVQSVEFGPDGHLYAVARDIPRRGQAYAIRINTSSGETTPVVNTILDMEGLTCGPGPHTLAPVAPPAPVPTPTSEPSPKPCDIFYALSGSAIYSIDIDSQTVEFVIEVGTFISEIAYEAATGILWAIQQDDNDYLVTIDIKSGKKAIVAQYPGRTRITGLAFVGEQLYGLYDNALGALEIGPSTLVRIDKNGSLMEVGTFTGYTFLGTLAFDGSTMWGSRPFELLTIDLNTGIASFNVNMSLQVDVSRFYISFTDIEVGPDGNLYGRNTDSLDSKDFFRIDKLTGKITPLFDTGLGMDISGLTCAPYP